MQQQKSSSSSSSSSARDEVVGRDEHDEKGSEEEEVVTRKKGVDESARVAGSGRSKEEDEEERYKKALEEVLEFKKTRNPETIRYVEKKLRDKGVRRMERHPVDGLSLAHGPPKSGHGGKFTWEGPADVSLDPAPPALDAKDPNYVDEEGDAEAAAGVVKGEVEVAKEAKEGVSRIEVQPPLQSLLTQ